MESTLPRSGTVSPRVTFEMPLGPCKTAVPLMTSRSVQPAMPVGFVSGVGMRCVSFCIAADDVFSLTRIGIRPLLVTIIQRPFERI